MLPKIPLHILRLYFAYTDYISLILSCCQKYPCLSFAYISLILSIFRLYFAYIITLAKKKLAYISLILSFCHSTVGQIWTFSRLYGLRLYFAYISLILSFCHSIVGHIWTFSRLYFAYIPLIFRLYFAYTT